MKALFVAGACALLSLLADVGAAAAQQPGRTYKIGWLTVGFPGAVAPPFEAWTGAVVDFRDALREAGFISGRNLVVEARHASGDAGRLAAEAEAFVASGVDLIVTLGTPPTVAAMQAAKRIPIVFIGVGDAVDKGIVGSLAQPGGNVTGQAVAIALPKQWQLLRDVAPSVKRASRLGNAENRPAADRSEALLSRSLSAMRADAAAVGIEPTRMPVHTLDEVEAHFSELARQGDAGVVVIHDWLFATRAWRTGIMEKAMRHRLPTSCAQDRAWADSGCLVSYVEDWRVIHRSAALQVIKVLKGVAPASIPVEQPTDYKIIVNAGTAKTIGLTVPPLMLSVADEVIE